MELPKQPFSSWHCLEYNNDNENVVKRIAIETMHSFNIRVSVVTNEEMRLQRVLFCHTNCLV